MSDFLDKLCPREQLAARAALPRPIVFTNGVFDIPHRGHVSYLAQAGRWAPASSSAEQRRVGARPGQGPDRPLNAEADRACVLAALESVSPVTLFDEPTPVELLKLWCGRSSTSRAATTTSRRWRRRQRGCAVGRRRPRAALRRRLLDHRAGQAHPQLIRSRQERFTSTMPPATAASATTSRVVIGSPSSSAPSSRPKTGVSSVNEASRVAG